MSIFLDKIDFGFNTNHEITRLIGLIDEFKGKWNIAETRENRSLKELHRVTLIESIGASCRIEGATFTDKEVEQVLVNPEASRLTAEEEGQIIGYYETMKYIQQKYETISLTENSIKHLHSLLFRDGMAHENISGTYKKYSNQVVVRYISQRKKILFTPIKPENVPEEMKILLKWVNQQFKEKKLHPLIIIAVFIYEFLGIQPFQYGNSRLSRILLNLCLLQQGYIFVKFISGAHHCELYRKSYFDALMDGQRNHFRRIERIDKWLLFYLHCIMTLSQKLDRKYDVMQGKGNYLNDRQKSLRNYILKSQPVKICDIGARFSDISINTLKKDLKYLRDEQLILLIGKKKGGIYIDASASRKQKSGSVALAASTKRNSTMGLEDGPFEYITNNPVK